MTTEETKGLEEEVDRVVKSAARIGTVWAQYGIEVGRAALRSSAVTLESTAELLGALSDKLGTPPENDSGDDAA
jgi:hypothetical protein